MAIRNDANFLLIPSAYTQGKIFAPIPSTGQGDLELTGRPEKKNRITKGQLLKQRDGNVPTLSYINMERQNRGKLLKCPACNVEEKKINHLIYSEDYKNNWQLNDVTIDNQIDWLNSKKEASELFQTASAAHIKRSIGNNIEYWNTYKTLSGYVKLSELETPYLYVENANTKYTIRVLFNVLNREVQRAKVEFSPNTKIHDAYIYAVNEENNTEKIAGVDNPWLRWCIVVESNDHSAFTNTLLIKGKRKDDLLLDDEVNIKIKLNAIQYESGIYESSYIKTSGSTEIRRTEFYSSVTTGTFELLEQGTIFLDVRPSELQQGKNSYIMIFEPSQGETFEFFFSWKKRLHVQARSQGVLYKIPHDYEFNDRMRIGVSFQPNKITLFVNGVFSTESTNFQTPIGLRNLNFSNMTQTESSIFKGDVFEMFILPYVLTNDQLSKITKYSPQT